MNLQKILIISFLSIGLIAAATIITFSINPQMHKKIQIEQIIYKYRSK